MSEDHNDIGVMVLADIRPAVDTASMIVVAPSYGSHRGECDMTDYPEVIISAFDRVSNYMNRKIRRSIDSNHVVKRLVSNNGVKNHPHAVLYSAPRSITLSESSERLSGAAALHATLQTIAVMAVSPKELGGLAEYVKQGLK